MTKLKIKNLAQPVPQGNKGCNLCLDFTYKTKKQKFNIMNITKIYQNEIYSDELVLIAVKGAVKQRKLKREDLAFLKEKAYLKDDEFGMKLLRILPLSNPYWRLPDTRTQAYLRRKRRENIPTKR